MAAQYERTGQGKQLVNMLSHLSKFELPSLLKRFLSCLLVMATLTIHTPLRRAVRNCDDSYRGRR